MIHSLTGKQKDENQSYDPHDMNELCTKYIQILNMRNIYRTTKNKYKFVRDNILMLLVETEIVKQEDLHKGYPLCVPNPHTDLSDVQTQFDLCALLL